ncbi:MAG TPA: hypothetical protein VFG45_12750 [Candidatus Nitrosocosmicus sp.]|nr:hypothetical protein [Candidatus Nitrosocosmicus sp.]
MRNTLISQGVAYPATLASKVVLIDVKNLHPMQDGFYYLCCFPFTSEDLIHPALIF